ncbi:non-hydrolyzing UDP-N-acetylglucosamine 2-epimerase [Palleronia marisminoris]|uniref:non-hydrolyzing UDP-N-acetylglucosamine 2-epimerase n=1 Tax=Palleronia marisminoris TaxID=315423 RepID=UPI001FE08F93|nr:UDP-N-acetylglucosamine 2-epimerase (non-hydrolyzing) [Palleronia marisminoris]
MKSAPVSRALQQIGAINEVMIHTGQHFDTNMSDIFFEELKIPSPSYNLGIDSLSHGAMTGRMLEALETTIRDERPDCVLVYGDTNSTIAAALAAAKLHIRVAHVEAGLRSFNRRMPEEINRILTDHCSDYLFTPTDAASRNLANEGIDSEKVLQVGDVMLDATIFFGDAGERHANILAEQGLSSGEYVLATIHRQDNTDDPNRLQAIFDGLSIVGRQMPVFLPLHPRTRSRLEGQGVSLGSGIMTTDPLGYLDMLALERQAAAIVTDSGGMQKEAYFQRVPCVTLRNETEWTELVETGWNRICPPMTGEAIAQAVFGAIGTQGEDVVLYGDGRASYRIAEELVSKFSA